MRDKLIVQRLTPNDRAQANDRLDVLLLREFQSRYRQFERTRYFHHSDIFFRYAVSQQRVDGCRQPPAGAPLPSSHGTPVARHAPSKVLAMVTAGFLTLLVMGGLFPNLWYGMHDITDLPVYWGYASRIAAGETPTRTPSRSSTPRSPWRCSACQATPAASTSTASGSTS